MDIGRTLLYGAVRTIPLAAAFGAYTITRGRRWGTVSSAVTASATGLLAGVGAFWLERQIATDEIEDAITKINPEAGAAAEEAIANLGLSGLGNVRRSMSPAMRRNLYGVGVNVLDSMSPSMRRQIYGGPSLGLVNVSRDFRRYG